MFEKFKSKLNIGNRKAKGISWQYKDDFGTCTGLPTLGLGCGESCSYDNAFPDIVRIAEAFAEVMPYAVNDQGRRLNQQPPVVRALYNPNEEMSGSDFLESLITMLLVHPLVHILVWHYEGGKPVKGGPITPQNIAGFTFLENAVVSRVNGETTFYCGSDTWLKQDVLTLSLNVNPYRLVDGYSPSQAVKKWATVDDFIAEYQIAQFANGGTPAGLMTITAQSVEAYNEAVDKIIAAHTGPSNANRIVYTHRPTSTIDGKPMAAGVEWTPFAQSNKELTLDSLFNQANKKIDMNFGVPEEVKGYLQNSNYASAEVADYVFARRILYPKIVKVYSKLNHELNRVMGGMPYALSYDFELPVLTDTRKVQADTLLEMVNAGFTIESAVEAMRLPKSFLKLEPKTEPEEENLQVEDTAAEKPSQAETAESSKAVHEHNCEHCSHDSKAIEDYDALINPTLKSLVRSYLDYLAKQVAGSIEGEDADSARGAIKKTRQKLQSDASMQALRSVIIGTIYYQLALHENEASKDFSRRLELETAPMTMSDNDLSDFNVATQTAAAQLQVLMEAGQSLEGALSTGVKDTIKLITAALTAHGIRAAIPDFAKGTNYEKQLDYLLTKFGKEHLDNWRDKTVEAISAAEVVAIIQSTIQTDIYPVNRWALTEQHRGEELGKLLAAEVNGEVAELEPYKIWRDRPGACDRCHDLAGETVEATELFSNGNMVPADHPNCRCYYDVIFKNAAKAVKVFCPNCKRYMFESRGGHMKNVICANSKCKKHYDFKIVNGNIEAKERIDQ